ncbi:MAG: GAF domain-containing protein [Chloroflexota bacterium]|nr:GAF domain-containing protein [Chloroflexota bacterium]
MTTFFSQLYELITSDSGALAYQLILAFSIAGALLSALNHWRVGESKQCQRLVLGLSILLALRLAYNIYAVLTWQNLVLGESLLPVLDRGVNLLSLLVIIWLWSFPEPSRAADAATMLLAVLFITLIVFAGVWWYEQSYIAGFYGSLVDRVFETSSIALITIGLLLLVLRRPKNWSIGVVMLLVLGTGHVFHLLYPPYTGDYAAAVRISQIIAYPLLFLLPRRLPVRFIPAQREPGSSSEPDSSEPSVMPDTDIGRLVEDFFSLLSISSHDETHSLVTRIVAEYMSADVCLLVRSAESQMRVRCGYDRQKKLGLPGLVLYGEQFPLITEALQERRILRLPTSQVSPDVVNLARFYDYQRLGHMLVVPADVRRETTFIGLMLLSTHSDRPWTRDDGERLSTVAQQLAQFLHLNQQLYKVQVSPDGMREELDSLRDSELRLRIEIQRLLQFIELIGQRAHQQHDYIQDISIVQLEEEQEALSSLQAANQDISRIVDLSRQIHELDEADIFGEELRIAKGEVALLGSALAEADAAIVSLKASAEKSTLTPQERAHITTLAQEFRQVANGINEYARLLLGESLAELQPIQRKFLTHIRESATRQDRIVDGLLKAVSAPERSLTQELEEVDLISVIDSVLVVSEPQLREKEIVISRQIPDDLPPVYSDPEALRVIITNLIQKLATSMPVKSRAQLIVSQESEFAENDRVVLQLGGENDASLEPLPEFLAGSVPVDGWFREDDLSEDGMVVVRTLVGELGGRIEIAGELGCGGRIRVVLPLKIPDKALHSSSTSGGHANSDG